MPRKSPAELMKEWEKLLEACRANERELPGIDGMMDPLASILVQVKVLEVVRRAMRETARETTLSLREVRENGRESARRLRSYVRSQLGSRNAELPRFGIAPISGGAGERRGDGGRA